MVMPNQKLVVIEFIIAIVRLVTKYILSILKHLTLFLQKTNCDMVAAFDEAQNTLNTLIKGLRTDEKFTELFARAQIIADTMEVVLQPMRRVGRQVHRNNPNVNFAEQLLRTTMYFVFLGHVNNELERRFPGDQRQIMLGQYLTPSKFDHLVD